MKTRSNDIIANAPFKYNSDTNTFEVGTNLYVDGNFSIQANLNTYGAIQSFNDSSLSFYQDNDIQSSYFDISPSFGQYELSFAHFDGQAITTTATLKIDGNCNILTNINVKTLFGNQSIYGSGNIDLYVHYLSFTINSKIYYGVVYSSNNLVVDSVQDLTTIMKSDGQILALGESDNALIAYVGGIWRDVFEKGNVTAVNDSVKTI